MDQNISIESETVYVTHHHGTACSVKEQENATMIHDSDLVSFIVTNVEVYVFAGVLFPLAGMTVNIKLYNNVKNETHQEKGKVIQRVMETYAIMQAIFWPCVYWGYCLILVDSVVYNLHQPCFIGYFKLAHRYISKLIQAYVGLNF